jgi:hypothetical protein
MVTSDRMRTTILIALIGGMLGVIGQPLVSFILSCLSNLLFFIMNVQQLPFHFDLWFRDVRAVLWWIVPSFISGVVAALPLAPAALRLMKSSSSSQVGFPKAGMLIGSLVGLLACTLLTFIRLTTDFVGPTLFHEGLSSFPTALRYYATYLLLGPILFGPFAACLGGCAGAMLEMRWRKHLRFAESRP